MKCINRNIGRFELKRDFVLEHNDLAQAVMGRCVVVRCEQLYHRDAFSYVAISQEFDEVPHGDITPFYDVIFSDDGTFKFTQSNVRNER